MKVVHLSTYDFGGAANAAIRLNQGLRQQNVESDFLCLIQNKPFLKHCHAFPPNPLITRISGSILDKIGLSFNKHKAQQKKLAKLGGQYEYFSFAQSDFYPENHPLVQSADIIHLHWISGFINYPTFFKFINKPIVWTLHDMNPFTGGFHYEHDNQISNEELQKLSLEQYQHKKTSIDLLSDNQLHIVTPSKWLMQLSQKSDIFEKFPHSHIPNGLDTDTFRIKNKTELPQESKLPQHKPVILFVSQEIDNHRKGFHLLKKALEGLSEELQRMFTVLVVGQGEIPLSISNLVTLGKVDSVEEMADIYNLADICIMPSIEDNLPNVMIESIACGTPVIAFNIGGIPDAIKHGKNGIIMDSLDYVSIQNAIKKFLLQKDEFDSISIAKEANELFSLQKQSLSYKYIYDSM